MQNDVISLSCDVNFMLSNPLGRWQIGK